ncbi:MAG: hypothetical protein HOK72_07545 [Flavobacteriales bacterium]|nr:hypothetical protein [Flavobacteriales bacterium]
MSSTLWKIHLPNMSTASFHNIRTLYQVSPFDRDDIQQSIMSGYYDSHSFLGSSFYGNDNLKRAFADASTEFDVGN